METFVSDLRAIRERARKHVEAGAVTATYKGEILAKEEEEHAEESATLLAMLRLKISRD